jgi:hypothetical protein
LVGIAGDAGVIVPRLSRIADGGKFDQGDFVEIEFEIEFDSSSVDRVNDDAVGGSCR